MATADKLRDKVDRFRRKGKFDKAAELQRQICQQTEGWEDWALLAELCSAAGTTELAAVGVAARFRSAKLRGTSVNGWLELAQAAQTAGFARDALDARFRAADLCAMQGDLQQAQVLCDEVLAADASHEGARRIRQVVGAQLARREQRVAEAETREEQTDNHWPPPQPDPRRGPDVVDFVCDLQPWPSVLDDHSLMFVGRLEDLPPAVVEIAEQIEVGPHELLCRQGQEAQLLYWLESGSVRVSRQRGGDQSLGVLEPGRFFGEVGIVAGLPCTATVTTAASCVVRVVKRERLSETPHAALEGVLRLLRSCYLSTVSTICPLLGPLEAEQRAQLLRAPVRTFTAGERICGQGEAVELGVILSGVARVDVLHRRHLNCMGFCCPGDLVGEINPALVTVTATSKISLLVLDKDTCGPLLRQLHELLALRRTRCLEAVGLSTADNASAAGR